MDLDGQAIERRDFPISRRGYEPAAVDAHLREIAAAVRTLQSELRKGGSVGESAGVHVKGILDAAEAAAAQIVQEAQARANDELVAAQREAQRVRAEALSRADAHTSAVGDAAQSMRERLAELEGKLQALTSTLLSGGSELTAGVDQLRGEMAKLYDAAAGRSSAASRQAEAEPAERSSAASRQAEAEPAPPAGVPAHGTQELSLIADEEPDASTAGVADGPRSPTASALDAATRSEDVDGARLIALNMALNGDSREQTERYLAEHFDLAERGKLVDEVFAAIDG